MTSAVAAPAGKILLGESVEESRAKRLEKQQSRYRDRGGLFVPADSNPLLEALLARGVNGESPVKQRSMAPSPSPVAKSKRSTTRGRKSRVQLGDDDALPVKSPRKRTVAAKRAPKPKIAARTASGKCVRHADTVTRDIATAAGPSKLPSTTSRKDKAPSHAPEHVVASLPATAVSAAGHREMPTIDKPGGRSAVSHRPTTKRNKAQPNPDSLLAGAGEGDVPKSRKGGASKRANKSKQHNASIQLAGKSTAKSSIPRLEETRTSRTSVPDAETTEPRLKRRAASEEESSFATASQAVAGPSQPHGRKRPKLYIPPDSDDDDEDDVPVVAALKAKAAQRSTAQEQPSLDQPRAPAGTKAPSSKSAARAKDPPSHSKMACASTTPEAPTTAADDEQEQEVPKKGRKKPVAQPRSSNKAAAHPEANVADHTTDNGHTATSRPAAAEAAEENATGSASKMPKSTAKRGRAKRKAADTAAELIDDDNDSAHTAADALPKSKGRAKAAGKRKERDVTPHQLPVEDLPEAAAEETRPAKRQKGAASEDHDGGKTKRLKCSSSGLKENRKAARSAKAPAAPKTMVPRPKPRMSMFPVPNTIEDSEDEIDFLR